MEYTLDIASPMKRKWVDAIMPSIIDKLGLNKSTHAVLVATVPATDANNEGSTLPIPGAGVYIVTLTTTRKKSLKDLTITLCHEMVHVKQMATGKLKPKKRGNMWNGKFYPDKTKYLDRPWEIKAFEQQELLMRRVIE